MAKSFYHASEKGGKTEIAMPPLPEPSVSMKQEVTPEYIEPVQEAPNLDMESEMVLEQSNEQLVDQVEEELEPVSENPRVKESFRDIRQAKEKAERDTIRAQQERDALMSQMLQMQAKQNSKPVEKEEEPADDLDLDIDGETLVEGKHLKKYVAQMKEMKKELRSYKSQSQQIVMQNKIKSEYPDFDLVFNEKTVTILNEDHPGIARALSAIPNDYDKAVAAYEMIKNLGITETLMKKAVVSSDKERALKNVVKPRTVTSVAPQQGDSPLSRANAFANGLTEELKEQLRKEMFDARRAH